jgi:NTP pyrophosphatase (non-canonical NTP hydrolase)
MVDMDQFQAACNASRIPTATMQYALLNLPGEVGELCGLVAKSKRDGPKPDHLELAKKELGDILWCVAVVAQDFGFTLSEVAQGNLDKVAKRQADGTIQGEGDYR